MWILAVPTATKIQLTVLAGHAQTLCAIHATKTTLIFVKLVQQTGKFQAPLAFAIPLQDNFI